MKTACRLRPELAEASERMDAADDTDAVRELRALAERVEAELGEVIKVLDWPAG